MASFTDMIPQFNPYVQQLPVEAMVQVGMAKQKAYEENVTKIQAEIDRVAGLDIMRGVDKEYLQSKMNALGNKLTLLAGGDFSNFQLANSVTGMAGQISKDKYVQNAVSSTAKYRKEVAKADALKKEGKWSINRQFDFDNEANRWLNDTNLETTFNGEFKEHRDVNKKVLDVIGKLHPNIDIKDFPYVINKDGSIDYETYASIMQKRGVKAVDEGQIKTAVNAVLDSDDYDELYSQGRYNYRGYGTKDLQDSATRSYEVSKKSYEEKLNLIERKLLTVKGEEQEELLKTKKYYENLLADEKMPGSLANSYKSALESIQTNPDQARSTLYTRNWLDQIANGFAYREVQDEVLANPGWAAKMKAREFELQQIKEAHDYALGLGNLEVSRGQLEVARGNLNVAQQKLLLDQIAAGGTAPFFVGSGDATTDNLESLQNYTRHIGDLITQNDGILANLAAESSSLKTQVKPSDILANIEKYKRGEYVPTDYEREQFNKYIQNANSVKQQQDLYDYYEKRASDKLSKGYTEKVNKELSKRGNLIIGGQTFSAKEVYNYLAKEKVAVYPSQGEAVSRYSVDDKDLTDREKVIKQALKNRYVGTGGSTGNATIDRYIGGFSPIIGENKNVRSQIVKQVAQDMADVTGIFKTEQAAVVFKDANEKNRFIGQLTNVAGANLNTKVAGQNYSPADLIESLRNKNESDIETQLERQGDRYFIKVVDKKDPKNIQRMPVSAEFVEAVPSLGARYLNQGLDLAQSLMSNRGSTNVYDDYDHGHYHNGFFGTYGANGEKTVTLPIVADLKKRGGQLYPSFKIMTKNGALPYEFVKPTDRATFESVYLPSLTDAKILSILKTKYPNIEQLISR